jgi:hypothetical protein
MEEGKAIVANSEQSVESSSPTTNAMAGSPALPRAAVERIPLIILGSFAVLLGYWFKVYLSSGYIASIDLPGHIAIIERMDPQLIHLRLFFYDPAWFTGWPAFQFYAFFAHAFTAILSLVVAPWSEDPVRLCCQALLWFGCVSLPFSVYYFALPLGEKVGDTNRLTTIERSMLAMSAGFLSFWFLNHDYEWHGVGGGAVLYIGLYSQIFAWHLLLVHGGALARLLRLPSKKNELLLCAVFSILLLTHTLTALFVLLVVLLLSIWLAKDRALLWRTHLVAFGMTAFWYVPALALSRDYAVTHIEWPSGDFFEMFFRYPFAALAEHAKGIYGGVFQALDLGTLEVGVFFLLFLSLVRIRRAELAMALFLIVLFCAFLLSSNFVASSIPVTFHYYRGVGYVFVYLTGLLAVVPLASCQAMTDRLPPTSVFRPAPAALIAIALLGGVYSTWSFPHSHKELVDRSTDRADLKADQQVLDYFKALPSKGRVFFESFKETARSRYRLARYAESVLFKTAGFETTSGLFIQSSPANQIISQVAVRGGARTWSCPLYECESVDRNVSEIVRQLRELGITHVVCNSGTGFYRNLAPYHVQPIEHFEPYAIVPIAVPPVSMVELPRKALVGYIDRLGTLPFKFVEYYLSAHPKVNSRIDLIDLTGRTVPSGLSGILLNDTIGKDYHASKQAADGFAKGLFVMRICFQNARSINHYNVDYRRTADETMCRDVDYFFNNFDLAAEVSKLTLPDSDAAGKPSLSWSDHYQAMTLSNLQPNHFVRVNYAYFPFWFSSDAEIYRGSSERIFVLPRSKEATLRYEPQRSGFLQIGIAVSLAAVLALPGVWSWLLRVLRKFGRRAKPSRAE